MGAKLVRPKLVILDKIHVDRLVDATVAAGFLSDPSSSKIVKSVGFANAPVGPGTPRGNHWYWSWNLAIPKSSKQEDAASRQAPENLQPAATDGNSGSPAAPVMKQFQKTKTESSGRS